MKRCVESLQKKTIDVIFNPKILYPRERSNIFKYTAKIGLWKIYWFSFSAARNAFTKAIEWVTFGFSLCILVFFPFLEILNVTANFLSVLPAIIQENFNERPWIEGFVIHSSTSQSGTKGEWRINSWSAISNTSKKLTYFFTCDVTAFLRARNLCITT